MPNPQCHVQFTSRDLGGEFLLQLWGCACIRRFHPFTRSQKKRAYSCVKQSRFQAAITFMNSASSFSTSLFKQCVSQFATGVAIVTTLHQKKLYGITVSSFASTSLSPPLISFNVICKGTKHRIFSEAESFAFHILSEDQESLSHMFAKSSSRESEKIPHEISALGNPIFSDALAVMECRLYAEYEAGDHSIILGEVLNVSVSSERDPLIYFRGEYGSLSSDD